MGASGGIGQPLSLLLKNSPLVTELSLYDIVNTPGVAADLSHIDTPARVKAFNGPDQLKDSLRGAQVKLMTNRRKENALTLSMYIKKFIIYFNFQGRDYSGWCTA